MLMVSCRIGGGGCGTIICDSRLTTGPVVVGVTADSRSVGGASCLPPQATTKTSIVTARSVSSIAVRFIVCFSFLRLRRQRVSGHPFTLDPTRHRALPSVDPRLLPAPRTPDPTLALWHPLPRHPGSPTLGRLGPVSGYPLPAAIPGPVSRHPDRRQQRRQWDHFLPLRRGRL